MKSCTDDRQPSKALEVNIATSRVDVSIDAKYEILLQIMEKYHGTLEGLRAFLKEICHPYKNWAFIIKEARNYSLNYLHVLKTHQNGPEAARIYVDIFLQAVREAGDEEIKRNASDNLMLYLQKIVQETGTALFRFFSVLEYAFKTIRSCDHDTFPLFVWSFYPLDRLGRLLSNTPIDDSCLLSLNDLLLKYYRYTYDYWLTEIDPVEWFDTETEKGINRGILKDVFKGVSHIDIQGYLSELETDSDVPLSAPNTTLNHLVKEPGFGWIVDRYGEIPGRLQIAGDSNGTGDAWKLIFLIHIMEIEGLSRIHEESLREINRTISRIMESGDPLRIRQALDRIFAILEKSVERFPRTALHCVLNMGQGAYKTDDSDLVDFFIDSVVSLGFQSPASRGVGNDWQVKVNPAHVQNIRTWLELAELKPKWSKKLISSLTIHLAIGGMFIRDTDLFPRDITRLLNSDIGPVYNLVKQLARLFPVYFNEIGAEGRLRDISTRIDDICLRKDPLIHFLRKQSHVESGNHVTKLMEATLSFWQSRNKEKLRPFLPPTIFEQIENKGPYVDGVSRIMKHLHPEESGDPVMALLRMKEGGVRKRAEEVSGVDEVDRERVALAVDFYKLLYQKYHLNFTDMGAQVLQLQATSLPDIGELKEALTEKDVYRKVFQLLSYLEKLKEIILAPEVFEAREDIYRKRHFTVDIPSMYGSYHEIKFDALGLSFRLESLLNVLFEELVDTVEPELITRATLSKILNYLRLFNRALDLEGITSLEMERHLDLLAHALEIRGFGLTQYLDIFRGFSHAVSNIVNDYYNNMHQANLAKILDHVSQDRLLSKFRGSRVIEDREEAAHRVCEIFLRDRIASSLSIQQLDRFLTRILNTLHNQTEGFSKEQLRLLLNYDPKKALVFLGSAETTTTDIIHLGNKGMNLAKLKDYGLPVPPGFIITTEVFRCREIIEAYPPARGNFEDQLDRALARLENETGKSFGDPRNPLLLSVRSGSAISQPGMMNTFLNVGINEAIVLGLIENTRNQWFGWDTFRRFIQSYGMAHGLERDAFDAVIARFKEHLGIPVKRDFSGEQMKRVALEYLSLLKENGLDVSMTPREQLLVGIRKVFESWHSPKAKTYRKIMGISDEWGTAVTVQAMVFGNFSPRSGSGVFFTHNPRWSGDMLIPWGDFTPGNQGEDIVSGLVRTRPISIRQAEAENREPETSLEILFPKIYACLREWAKDLIYGRKWTPQEMEFTFEGPEKENLFFLQTRDMGMRGRKTEQTFETDAGPQRPLLGHGIGVSGGAMTGRVVFTLEEIKKWRRREPDTSLILIRGDTVPDDIREIYEADGLLTARGGSTSHAAIVAHRLGKTCVVGFSRLICMEKDRACAIGSWQLGPGDHISIDGKEGAIYIGTIKVKNREEVLGP